MEIRPVSHDSAARSKHRSVTVALRRYRDVAPIFAIDPSTYPPGYQGYKLEPIIGTANPNITCGRAAFDSAPHTETADVLAGSEIGFRVSADGYGNRDATYSGFSPYPRFWHAGPGQIYLSRAPNDDLQSYRGDGDWFKIAYAGPVDNQHWALWPSVSDVRFPPLLVLLVRAGDSELSWALTAELFRNQVQLHHPENHPAW